MQANPILVELTRGNWVENRHRAALVVSDAIGQGHRQGRGYRQANIPPFRRQIDAGAGHGDLGRYRSF